MSFGPLLIQQGWPTFSITPNTHECEKYFQKLISVEQNTAIMCVLKGSCNVEKKHFGESK